MNQNYKNSIAITLFISLFAQSINAGYEETNNEKKSLTIEERRLKAYSQVAFRDRLKSSLLKDYFCQPLQELPVDGKQRVVENFPKILATQYIAFLNRFYDKFCKKISNTLQEIQSKDIPKLIKAYGLLETQLQQIKHNENISLFGGINWAMNSKEMQKVLCDKFQEFKNKNLIITQKKFEMVKNQYYTDHQGNYWTDKDIKKDLSRVWTALFLKKRINKNKNVKNKYDIPDFIIVASDTKKITIRMWGNREFPVAGFLENGEIYFKRINGTNSGCNKTVRKAIGEHSPIGYLDICSDNCKVPCLNERQDQNIIQCSATKTYYIVDTEFNSSQHFLNDNQLHSLWYGFQKFCYENNVNFSKYKNDYGTPQSVKDIDKNDIICGKASLTWNITLK